MNLQEDEIVLKLLYTPRIGTSDDAFRASFAKTQRASSRERASRYLNVSSGWQSVMACMRSYARGTFSTNRRPRPSGGSR